MSESDTLLEGYHFIRFYHILLFCCIKAFGIYYLSIAARKRHRQNGCCLEVLDNKVINEEDISQEDKKSEVLEEDDNDDHSSIITQPGITCPKLTTETLEQGVKYVQSSGVFIVDFEYISYLILVYIYC